ncbi:hypothetical protein L1049_028450 [Liquidambar formosana]|uniref:Uncharacterized protein n=1 Tax=Liquidambar formosana TaxID=63359 RepID=A0AAP0RIR7_LIQFO
MQGDGRGVGPTGRNLEGFWANRFDSSESTVRCPGKAPGGAIPSPSPGPACGDPLSLWEQLEHSTGSRRVRDWDPRAQPSEPILFPKLRIHFADFPCLHCSIDQRLFTLET